MCQLSVGITQVLIFSTMVRALDVLEEHLEECGVAQACPALSLLQLTSMPTCIACAAAAWTVAEGQPSI